MTKRWIPASIVALALTYVGRLKAAAWAFFVPFCGMIFAMMVPNMIGLMILFPVVREELGKYLKAIKKT